MPTPDSQQPVRPATRPSRSLQFYTKAQCSLCDRLKSMIVCHCKTCNQPVIFEEIDITTNADLFGRYRFRIPVVMASDGQIVLEGKPEASEVARALEAWLGD